MSSSRKHNTFFHFRRCWNISEESWDGKIQWRGKGTVNESGKRDQISEIRILLNLRYIDRKKVREANAKINKIVSFIKTETITKASSALRAAGNVVAKMVGYKNKEMTGDRKPNWRKRILEKQKVLLKELGQLNRMRWGELQNEGVISKLER